MSAYVFPSNILGLGWDIVRTPVWNTIVQTSPSGKTASISNQVYPLLHFELTYDLLRDDLSTSDLKAIVGLFNAVQGRYDTFLFTDPDFNSVTLQNFGTGNGTAGPYQLTATYGNTGGPYYSELVQNVNGTANVYVSGVLQTLGTAYTLGSTGIVTFLSGHFPAAAAPITWTGSFYYRCRFDKDQLQLSKFMNQWWAAKQIAFTSVKL